MTTLPSPSSDRLYVPAAIARLAADPSLSADNFRHRIRMLAEGNGPPPEPQLPAGGLLRDQHADPPVPPHLDLIADRGATVIFGRGGIGKGVLTLWIIRQAIRALHWKVAIIDAEPRLYEWKPRAAAMGFTEAELTSIYYVEPLHRPIWDQISEVKQKLEADDFAPDLVVVDSISRACAADISTGNNQVAGDYYRALDDLCPRHLSVAHPGRNDNVEQPFGSQRWYDDSRLMWGYTVVGEHRILRNHKRNEGPLLRPMQFSVTAWTEGAIPYPVDLASQPYAESLGDTLKALVTRPMRFQDIIALLNEDLDDRNKHQNNSIAQALRRGPFTRLDATRNPLWAPQAAPSEPEIPLHSCHRCGAPLPAEDTALDGQYFVHRGICPPSGAVIERSSGPS